MVVGHSALWLSLLAVLPARAVATTTAQLVTALPAGSTHTAHVAYCHQRLLQLVNSRAGVPLLVMSWPASLRGRRLVSHKVFKVQQDVTLRQSACLVVYKSRVCVQGLWRGVEKACTAGAGRAASGRASLAPQCAIWGYCKRLAGLNTHLLPQRHLCCKTLARSRRVDQGVFLEWFESCSTAGWALLLA